MKIGIVGLGLIGGSMAKAISRSGEHEVIGFDRADAVLYEAKKTGAIQKIGEADDIAELDMLLLALYPKDSIAFVCENAERISKACVVCDFGGVKQIVCEKLEPVAKEHGFTFVGGHPMAGRELSGFLASQENLFDGASMILTPADADSEPSGRFRQHGSGH